jgi:hypothetical protein
MTMKPTTPTPTESLDADLTPRAIELTRRFGAALIALVEIARESAELTGALGVPGNTRNSRVKPPAIAATGNFGEPHGEIATFFRNAVEARAIDVADIPTWLREAWSADGRPTFKTPADARHQVKS